MYLKYIDNKSIDRFVKSIGCPYSRNIIVADSEERNYVNVFTNMLDTTLHITDYECINMLSGKIYSKEWRKFVINTLDKIEQGLGDQYIDGLHGYLEQDTIVGPIL
ncbi:MAG: hypothetical protein ACLRFE_04545 [Clostridia bacterium]